MNKGKILSWIFTLLIIAFYFYYFYYIYVSYSTAVNSIDTVNRTRTIMSSPSFYDNAMRYTHLRENQRDGIAFPITENAINFMPSRTGHQTVEEGRASDGLSYTLGEGDTHPTRHYGRSEIKKRELTNRNDKILIDLGDITNDFQIKISDFWLDVNYSREEFSRNLPLFLDIAVVHEHEDSLQLVPGTIITQKLTRELSLEIGEESSEYNMFFKIRPKQQQLGKFTSPEKLKNDLSLMINLKSDAVFRATISDLKIDFFG